MKLFLGHFYPIQMYVVLSLKVGRSAVHYISAAWMHIFVHHCKLKDGEHSDFSEGSAKNNTLEKVITAGLHVVGAAAAAGLKLKFCQCTVAYLFQIHNMCCFKCRKKRKPAMPLLRLIVKFRKRTSNDVESRAGELHVRQVFPAVWLSGGTSRCSAAS